MSAVDRAYPVLYKPRVFHLVATSVFLVEMAVIEVVLGLVYDLSLLVVAGAVLAVAAVGPAEEARRFRRPARGRAYVDDRHLVLYEEGPWWLRLNLFGPLRVRVDSAGWDERGDEMRVRGRWWGIDLWVSFTPPVPESVAGQLAARS